MFQVIEGRYVACPTLQRNVITRSGTRTRRSCRQQRSRWRNQGRDEATALVRSSASTPVAWAMGLLIDARASLQLSGR